MKIRMQLKRYKTGALRPNWYAIIYKGRIKGKKHREVITLCEWRGEPPKSGSALDRGDDAFEASRVKAEAMAARIYSGEASAAEQEVEARRVYRARYKQIVPVHKLVELPALWDAIPKKKKPGADRIAVSHLYLQRFIDFMAELAPNIEELGAITAEHLNAYVDALPKIAGEARSCNEHLSVLRRVYRYAAPASVGCAYLKELPNMSVESVHREPFTAEQLRAVYQASQSDPLLRPLVVCAACTAMRRKDVALLKWESVNLAERFIVTKAAKTGATCEIPIFPELMAELEKAASKASRLDPKAFVWPDAASIYQRNADALNRGLNAILEAAGFAVPKKFTDAEIAAAKLPILAPEKMRRIGLEAIRGAAWTDKRRKRTEQIFTRYINGESVNGIAKAMRSSKAIVSMSLNAIEKMIGAQVIRRRALSPSGASPVLMEMPQGSSRKKRASLRGWHTFKTTWITLALTSGLPMELVQRVAGNKSVDVVLKHYFKPGREQMRQAFNKSMPALLADPEPIRIAITPKAIAALAKKLNGRNWKAVKRELEAMAAAA